MALRGSNGKNIGISSYVDPDECVTKKHPLRPSRAIVNGVLADLSSAYSFQDLPSIVPEKLIRGLLLQAFYSIRWERQLMEQLDFNLPYRWFVDLGIDEVVPASGRASSGDGHRSILSYSSTG